MKLMSWPQAIVLLIGLCFILLALIIPFSHYNIYYVPDEPPIEGVTPVLVITCPPPADQPSCDEFDSAIKRNICEDCNQIASSKWLWFIILESCLVIGTIGGYVMFGFVSVSKPETGGSV